MAGDYIVSEIYGGGYSSLKSNYSEKENNTWNNFMGGGYRVKASELGAPTKPDTANQIQQVNMLLNQGIVPIEVGALNPDIFEQIPKQHFKELNRMAKLTGAKLTVHAPLVEPSGVDQQSGWNPLNREVAENRLKAVVDKTFELRDTGGVPITIHSANMGGTVWKMQKDGKAVVDHMAVINRETGQVQSIQIKPRFYPGYSTKHIKEIQEKNLMPSYEDELRTVNNSQWRSSISPAFYSLENSEKIFDQTYDYYAQIVKKATNEKGVLDDSKLNNTEKEIMNRTRNAIEYLEDAELTANNLFNKAYQYGTNEQKKKLLEIAEDYKKILEMPPEELMKIKGLTPEKREFFEKQGILLDRNDPKKNIFAVSSLLKDLSEKDVMPQMFQRVEEFGMDQSAKTFANVALHSYEQSKKLNKDPAKISIENVYPGIAFSTGDEMAKLIEASREKFVEAAKTKGISESEAKKAAEEIIGITFDVGHLNIHKKHGYSDEQLIGEAKKFAKYVKHVHLTDNFGYSDSHLPLGMGNVPIKEHLAMLEKEGVLKDVIKIAETPGWPQQFGSSPMIYNLEGLGSPIFSYGQSPYWNQSGGLYSSYSSGFGMMLPQVNYEMMGAGFSQLPSELGGQRMGQQGSRMSNRPME
jgi:hypothetical protein